MTEAVDNENKRQKVFSLFEKFKSASLESILNEFSQAAVQIEKKHAEDLGNNLKAAIQQPTLSIFSNPTSPTETKNKPSTMLFSVPSRSK